MSVPRFFAAVVVLIAAVASTPAAFAHDVAATNIARVFIAETAPHHYTLTIPDPGTPPLAAGAGLLPAGCEFAGDTRFLAGVNGHLRFRCEQPLTADDVLVFQWRLAGVVVVAAWRDGSVASAYFAGGGTTVRVRLGDLRASGGPRVPLARRYFVLGAEHILFGIDHLLFVLGLLLLVSGVAPLVKTITAFTVAHSLTLGATVLGVVAVDPAPVEAAIALSIVLLAREIVTGARGARHLVHERPWIVASIFGLLHGFGFAGALGEIGLRLADVPFALLFFNLGVEAGQLAFVAVLLATHRAVRHGLPGAMPRLKPSLGYTLGIVATFWFFDRFQP